MNDLRPRGTAPGRKHSWGLDPPSWDQAGPPARITEAGAGGCRGAALPAVMSQPAANYPSPNEAGGCLQSPGSPPRGAGGRGGARPRRRGGQRAPPAGDPLGGDPCAPGRCAAREGALHQSPPFPPSGATEPSSLALYRCVRGLRLGKEASGRHKTLAGKD